MSITPIPLSSLKREKLNSHINSFAYQLYECSYLLRLKRFKKDEVNVHSHSQSMFIFLSLFTNPDYSGLSYFREKCDPSIN